MRPIRLSPRQEATRAICAFLSVLLVMALLAPASSAAPGDLDDDGIGDLSEDSNLDLDNDPSTTPGPDTDGDTIANYLDPDDDGDGTPTTAENADPNGDGNPRDAKDADRDGQPDYLDPPTGRATPTVSDEQKISDTAGGLTVALESGDSFGSGVAPIGDLDGDGINDVIVGADFDDDGGDSSGAVYVLFLNANGSVKTEQKISDTFGGLSLPLAEGDTFGSSVAGLGDLDGDGIEDVLVGADQDDTGGASKGAVYVLLLNADGTVKSDQKIAETTGGLAATLPVNSRFGSSVTGLGDLDGDGINDAAIGAVGDDTNGPFTGAVYIVFLNADGTVKAEQKITHGIGGLTTTIEADDTLGNVASIGDLDGDGIGDLAVGAYADDDGGTDRGAVYVLFLNADGTVKAEQKISDTTGGLSVTLGDSDFFGSSVGALGDIDNDGAADIVVGAMWDDDAGANAGAVYVLGLNTDGTVRTEQKITEGLGGMTGQLNSWDLFGGAVAGVGDLDRDGAINLIVGASSDDDGNPNQGAVYIFDLTPHPTVTVNSSGDLGDSSAGDGVCSTGGANPLGALECTLRAAMEEANASAVVDTINFDIPTADTNHSVGVWTIAPAVALPTLIETTIIDGITQPGSTVSTTPSPAGLNTKLAIQLDGVSQAFHGLTFGAGSDGSAVSGLSIGRFDSGVRIGQATDISIVGSWIGIDAGGADFGNSNGIDAHTGAERAQVGGGSPAERNLISGNDNSGVVVWAGSNFGAIIEGNLIGTDSTGLVSIPNNDGVRMATSDSRIGGPTQPQGNVISGNTAWGVTSTSLSVSSNTFQGNLVGVGSDGTTPVGNGAGGIKIGWGSDNNLVGGTGPSEGNVVAHNGGPGVFIFESLPTYPAKDISVLGNKIFLNAGVGIDIGETNVPDGVSPIDANDADTGANDMLNFPVLTSGVELAGTVTVDFTLDVPAGNYRIEFFTNPSGGDASGNGEGEVFVNGAVITHAGSGSESFSTAFVGSTGGIVTATTTEDLGAGSYGATSEFSNSIAVALGSFCLIDSDNDGLWDCEEDANTDADANPTTNPGPDTDGDANPNYLDSDDDNDSIPTASENADPNNDGDPRDALDTDHDGQPDYLDVPTTAAALTATEQSKISSTQGAFTGPLLNSDLFGGAASSIGDLDNDGVVDLAVGAHLTDDVTFGTGAVHVLLLNADGSVRADQKISANAGGLVGPLDGDDYFGSGVAGIGDVDGDGVPDIAVGASRDDDGGTNRGAVYVLFMNRDGTVRAEQKISSTAGGVLGPIDDDDGFGASVAGVGDLNGDGVPDMAVGATYDDDGASRSGAIYVLFLNADGTVNAEQKISATAGGLVGPLDATDYFGISISNLGDIDADGTIDLAVGAYFDGDGGPTRGAVYILFLNSDGTVKAEQKLSSTTGGAPTLENGDWFGYSVAGLGDVDLDGVGDLLVGAMLDDDGGSAAGSAYVLLLNPDGTIRSAFTLSALFGPAVLAVDPGDQFGTAATGLGDLDGDGTIGFAIGARNDDDGGSARGAMYVFDLAPLVDSDGDGLWDYQEDQNLDRDGNPATNAGPDTDGNTNPNYLDPDDDGDGIPTTSENPDPNTDGDPRDARDVDRDGQPDYLDIEAGPSATPIVDEQKVSSTSGGLVGPLDDEDVFGRSVTAIGDLDGDGVVDVVVGADSDDDGGPSQGAIYVLFMNANGTVRAEQKISSTQGGLLSLGPGGYFGSSVSAIGDIDGDGVPDLAVGALAADDGGDQRGAVYVLFLNSDGTVRAEQRISDTNGGLGAALNDFDQFGTSVAGLGDTDGDGVGDIAVGAPGDDDGGADRGAVYVLFLNTDGTVKAELKISDISGGLSTALDDNDRFGESVAGFGDIDGDGVGDLAVGAPGDDDGGAGRGAIYILQLNADGTVKAKQKISDTQGGLTTILDDADMFGASIAGLGDTNGDGIPDVAVGAPADDDAGTDRGALYILVLNPDGTVQLDQKISDIQGGLTAALDDTDRFGGSVASLGDMDSDGALNIAVGAFGDDDGGADRGAIYILDLAYPESVVVNSTGDLPDLNPGDSQCDTGGTNGDGVNECTLRAAIEEANASASIDSVEFALTETDPNHTAGAWTISPTSALPDITTTMSIDGTSQTGFVPNTNPAPQAINWTQVIMIDGGAAPAGTRAMGVLADDVSISGLTIGNFYWSNGFGIEINADRTSVTASAIGADLTGLVGAPLAYGIWAAGSDITIGGSTPGDRNLITGADNGQINLSPGPNALIDGNLIGTNVNADTVLAPWGTGVEIWGGANVVVGTAAAGNVIAGYWGIEAGADGARIENNLIGTDSAFTADLGDWQGIGVYQDNITVIDNVIGNWDEGLEVVGNGAIVQGNSIGTDQSGTLDIGMTSWGVRVSAAGAKIGGELATNGNQIANNGGEGIRTTVTDATIIGNRIWANAALGIDALADGVTTNSDIDTVLNYPVITEAQLSGGVITADFTLDVPAGDYRIEFFANSAADPSGHGEAETIAAVTSITHTGTGSESFSSSFAASAGDLISATATRETTPSVFAATSELSLTVRVNGPPVFNGDLTTLSDAEGSVISIAAAATDPDLDAMTYSATGLPAGISYNPVSGVLEGAMSPVAAAGSPYLVTLNVADGNGGFAVDTFTWTVTDTNRQPTIVPLSDVTADELTNVTFTATATDPDLPTNTITYTATGLPAGATLNPTTGVFNWTPTETQGPGTYPITITATDNGTPTLSDTTTITITTTETNNPPNLTPVGDQLSGEGSTVTVTPASTDDDVPTNTPLWSATNLPPGLTVDSATGVISGVVSSTAGAGSPYAVTITVDDQAGGTDTETLSWAIVDTNQNPTLTPIAPITVDEGAAISFTAVGSDLDLPADSLTYSATGLPAGATFDGPSATFNWNTDELDGPGTYVVTITVTDDGAPNLNSSQPVIITIDEDNTAPTIVPLSDVTADELTNVTFTATATDPDLPTNTITYTATGLPAGATLNPTTGVFNWTPTETQGPGTYPITITATDNGTPTLSDTTTITITTTETNNPPNLTPLADVVVSEETTTAFTVSASDPDLPGNALRFSATGLPAGATLDPSTGEFTWTPTEADGPNLYTVDFLVTDDGFGALNDSQSITIVVNEVNTLPQFSPMADISAAEGDLVDIVVSATDADIPLDTLTYAAQGLPPGLTIDPVSGRIVGVLTYGDAASGPFAVRVTVSDGNGGVSTSAFSLLVQNTNRAPVVQPAPASTVNELESLSLSMTATDPDLNGLAFSLDGAPSGMTIDPNSGQILWTPKESQGPATYSFDVVATDDDSSPLSGTTPITVSVAEVNTAPQLAASADRTAFAESELRLGLTAVDTDAPANRLTFAIQDGPDGIRIDPTTGVITWSPSSALVGSTHNVTVVVTDDGSPALVDQMSFLLEVNPPTLAFGDVTAVGDSFTIPFGKPALLDLLGNDLGDELLIGSVSTPDNGSASVQEGGSVWFTPALGFVGTTAFDYSIGSADGGSATATVLVIVSPPELFAFDDKFIVMSEESFVLDVLVNDMLESPIVGLTFGDPTHGTIESLGGMQHRYIPNDDFAGVDRFRYTITNGFGIESSAIVEIDVRPAGLAPAVEELVDFDIPKPEIPTVAPRTLSFGSFGLPILKALRALQLPTQLVLISGMWALLFAFGFMMLERRTALGVVTNVDRFETATVYSVDARQEIFELRHDADLIRMGRRTRRKGVWYRKIDSPVGPGLIEDRLIEEMNQSYLAEA